ncbi:YjbE family integral membrane protein [Anaerospora hongkongensis]|uniref:YjbE family integral membrane protein n=1 Tax=Anaerospora hongkongensis TaxID=244830 RepID=A0A4V2Q8H3_9FIRM|nr:TerC family protein [Anaerospora hongkongensis]TCL36449.1 YjbE family integral membrane protein [Anaerospora hongkongensis]
MELLVPLFSIIMINLLLSGDNALVIALASRALPKAQQKKAIFWGGAGAVGLRILLTLFAIILLQVPYLQFAGGLLLLWVAVKLMKGEHESHEDIKAASTIWDAVKTILIADLVMSLDNVIAIAGVAKGHLGLLIIGLAISIPIILWGSRLIMSLMEKWPVIITAGAAFLGWTAGEMMTGDTKIEQLLVPYPWAHWLIPLSLAIFVIVVGKMLHKPAAIK